MFENLRRVARDAIRIIRNDPSNLMVSYYLRYFFRLLRSKKFCTFNHAFNGFVRAPGNSRLARPIAQRGRKPPWRQKWAVALRGERVKLDHLDAILRASRQFFFRKHTIPRSRDRE